MTFSQAWKSAFENRDKQALNQLIGDEFRYIRHQSGKDLSKSDIVEIWSSAGPRPVRCDYRVIYENEDVLVTHQFMNFPSGAKESVMVVMLLKDGKLIRMETGATPLS
ncbi:nuclear transport factor 2 family protein [Shimia sagamensis]|uniref:DUF4440 domain-containing protein n=1 Tax=Shimia sagamensis TaxID=1566352 RepID=A0ABY1NRH9_9RHOB|nr:nuclear transport factor 2 family protein [Shimia sagamensis]SMP16008.1 hypothetical protein SAMN06265373_1034 [Shimia sagamensis]